MSTKKILIERVGRELAGGFESSRDRVTDEEIEQAIIGEAARLTSAINYDVAWKQNDSSIALGASIYLYQNVPVTPAGPGRCQCRLPAAHLPLPEGAGIQGVWPTGFEENFFFQIEPGMYWQVKGDNLINPLSGGCYEETAGVLTIYSDLIGANLPTVDMRLVSADLGSLGMNDLLPVPPDMIETIFENVAQKFISLMQYTERSEGITPNPPAGAKP